MLHKKSARIMLIASMAIFGTLGPFVRNITVSSGELALYRALMAAVLLAAFLLLSGQRIAFREVRKELVLLLLSGIAMGINWILLFEAYKYTTVSVATLSYYFAPVIVTVACPILFKEKITAKQIICFMASTAGLVLVIGISGLGDGGRDHIGILFGLGAAVFYASVVLINKMIKTVAGLQRTLFQFVGAVVILIPYVLCTSGVTLSGMDTTGWICLLAVGLIHTGVAYCMYFSALNRMPGQEAAILSYVDPVVAVMVSLFVLGEPMTVLQIAGGVLILGFTLLNELNFKKRKAEKTISVK